MKLNNSIKSLLNRLFWLGSTVFMVLLLEASSKQHSNSRILPEMVINIDYEQGFYFLDENDIKDIIDDVSQDSIARNRLSAIDMSKIEKALINNPFIRHADVYTDLLGTLVVDVIQREPIIRVMHSNGVGYYLDQKGEKIPHSGKFTARVPVATGFLTEQFIDDGPVETPVMKGLYKVAFHVHNDPFLHSLVEQVFINEHNQYEIIPKVGNHTVLLGSPDNLKEKFRKLFIFYKEGLKNIGWADYTSIDLRYSNQIVCKKHGST